MNAVKPERFSWNGSATGSVAAIGVSPMALAPGDAADPVHDWRARLSPARRHRDRLLVPCSVDRLLAAVAAG